MLLTRKMNRFPLMCSLRHPAAPFSQAAGQAFRITRLKLEDWNLCANTLNMNFPP